jgi:hypothetical protein
LHCRWCPQLQVVREHSRRTPRGAVPGCIHCHAREAVGAYTRKLYFNHGVTNNDVLRVSGTDLDDGPASYPRVR